MSLDRTTAIATNQRAARTRLIARLLVLCLFCLLGPAWVQASTGCQLSAAGAVNSSVTPGTSAAFAFNIIDFNSCTGASGTLTVTSNTTGGGGVSQPTFTGALNANIPFTINTGTTPGLVEVTVNCTAGCTGVTTLNYRVSTATYSLQPNSPTLVGTGLGAPASLIVQVLRNGVGLTSTLVNFTASGPGGFGFNPTPPVTSNASGIATIQFSSNTQGTYNVTGSFCNPDFLPTCVAIPTNFQVRVGNSVVPKPGNPTGGNANTTTGIIKVTALDGSTAMPSIPINWSIPAGNATIGTSSSVTDVNGDAGATVNLGPAPGTPVTLRATRTDTGSFVDIPLAIFDDYNLSAISPLTLTTGPGQPLAITTRYLLNGAPNPSNVGYNVVPAGPSLVPGVVTPNVSTGDATTTFTSAAVGTYTVTASGGCPTVVPNCPPMPIAFTVNVVNATLTGGGAVQANPGEVVTLSATAQNNGTAAPGVSINWTLNSGGGSPTSGSSITNGAGVATFAVTVGNVVPSTINYSAVRTDAPSATASFVIDVVAPTLALVSGNNQTGLTTSTSALPLVVELRDGKTVSSPLPGKSILWSTLSGPAFPQGASSITDAAGRASIFANFGGAGGASVIQAMDAGPGLASVNFNLTSLLPTLVRVSGDGQTGAPGASLSALLVRAENNATAAPGVTINWTVVSGGATLSAATTTTDGAGQAQVIPTLPVNGGASVIRAARGDQPGVNTTFAISSSALLTLQSGDGQTGAIGTPAAQPLVARLGAGPSPVTGANVDWQVVSGGGSVVLSSPTTITDGNGEASQAFSFGGTPGTAVVRASALGGTTFVDYTVTAVSRDLFAVSGSGQNGLPGASATAPLVVRAESNGSPETNIPIQWTVSGDATLSASNTSTDGSGQSSVNVTFGASFGAIQVTATRTDSGAQANFTLSVGANLSIVSGNGQSGVPNSIGDAPLVVLLTDLNQNPIAGSAVQWRVLSGAATLNASNNSTDNTGRASNTLRYGTSTGPVQIEASALNGLVHALFQAQVSNASLTITGGQNQSGPVASDLPLALKIRVAEVASNSPNAKGRTGVPVTWTVVSGGGTLSQQSTSTDSNGEATATLRLGPNRGANTVRAEIPGNQQVLFQATGLITNATLSAVSGNAQTLPTNTVSDPLVVRLLDSSNRGVEGVSVQWTGNNAVLGSSTCVTDANGQCSITVKVDLPGGASVLARTTDPTSGPVTFTLNGAVAALDNLNPRQAAVADAIDQACPALAALGSARSAAQNDLFQRCREIVDAAGARPDAASAALEALFPNVALVQSSASLLAAQAQQDNLKARLGSLRSGAASNPLAGLTVAGPGGMLGFGDLMSYLLQADGDSPQEIGAEFSRWGFFASGQLGRAEADANPRRPAYDLDINGLTVGVDYRKSDRLVLGAAVGYTRQDADLDNDLGTLETSGYSLSAYASYYYGNNWYLDSVLTWGQNQFDLDRQIQYSLPTTSGGTQVINQRARASSDGDMQSISATVGRDFQVQAWSFGPYARLTYSKFGFDQTTEELNAGAGSGLGMVLETRDIDSLVGVLGARISFTHSASWGILIPTANLEWESEFKDDPSVLQARFLNDPTNTPITLSSTPYDQDFLRLGLGLSMVLSGGKSGFIQYERSIGRDGFNQDNLNLGLRIEF